MKEQVSLAGSLQPDAISLHFPPPSSSLTYLCKLSFLKTLLCDQQQKMLLMCIPFSPEFY